MENEEVEQQVRALLRRAEHQEQVEAGLIPPDSPEDFVVPQPTDERGLPWWFGPTYKPTAEALDEFEKPPDTTP